MLHDRMLGPTRNASDPIPWNPAATAIPPARNGRPCIARPGVITQDELRQYRALKIRLKQIEEDLMGRRDSLKRRLQGCTQVEPGPLAAELRSYEERRLTVAELERLLGQDTVAQLKELVTPTTQHQLWVTENS